MTNLPPAELQSERTRNQLARHIGRHGADAGREIDHLKLRSLSPAAMAALAAAETGGLAVPACGQLTQPDGDQTLTCWLIDLSRFDGSDCWT